MKWTNNFPDKSGIYWNRDTDGNATIIEVVIWNDEPPILYNMGSDVPHKFEHYNDEWLGPIHPIEETK